MLKVYEVEERFIEKLNKNVKKLVIQKEGLQYPFRNVSAWQDLPIYNELVAGYQIPDGYDIFEKDGKNINPKSGKPYKERTLVAKENAGKDTRGSFEEKALTALGQINFKLDRLLSKDDVKQAADSIEYPEEDGIDASEIPF